MIVFKLNGLIFYVMIVISSSIFSQQRTLSELTVLESIYEFPQFDLDRSALLSIITYRTNNDVFIFERQLFNNKYEVLNGVVKFEFVCFNLDQHSNEKLILSLPKNKEILLSDRDFIGDIYMNDNFLYILHGRFILTFKRTFDKTWVFKSHFKTPTYVDRIYVNNGLFFLATINDVSDENGFGNVILDIVNDKTNKWKSNESKVLFCPQFKNQHPNKYIEFRNQELYILQPVLQEIIVFDFTLKEKERIVFSQPNYEQISTVNLNFITSGIEPVDYFPRIRSMLRNSSWNWMFFVLNDNYIANIYNAQLNDETLFSISVLKKHSKLWELNLKSLTDKQISDKYNKDNLPLGLFSMGNKIEIYSDYIFVFKKELKSITPIGLSLNEYKVKREEAILDQDEILKVYIYSHEFLE